MWDIRSRIWIRQMSIKIFFTGALMFLFKIVPAQNLIQYVQPLSGTTSSTTTSALKYSEAGSEGNANTIPSVGLPFAMTMLHGNPNK